MLCYHSSLCDVEHFVPVGPGLGFEPVPVPELELEPVPEPVLLLPPPVVVVVELGGVEHIGAGH